LHVNGIWSDEIDGETPSMARGTRALPKSTAAFALDPHQASSLALLFGNLSWRPLSIEIDLSFCRTRSHLMLGMGCPAHLYCWRD
jgi:hypothetical protein